MALVSVQPNYKSFKSLSLKRIEEAQILLANKQYSGAYYLAGYSIELALKACFCKGVKAKSFPDKDVVGKLYNHDLNKLLDVSGIKTNYEKKTKKDKNFATNWQVVKDWSEESRYNHVILKGDAESLIAAITDKKKGILNWIKRLW